MIIAYRTSHDQKLGWYHGNQQQKAGKVTRVKPGSATEKKMRRTHYPSECDWMVPTLFPWVDLEKSDAVAKV